MDIEPHERNCENIRAKGVASSALLEPKPRRRNRVPTLAIMAAALGAWHEPMALARLLGPELKKPREKTPEDFARIAAASEKRARKEAARERQRRLSKGSNRQAEGRRDTQL